jgi:RHS repeat-associated protein
MALTYELVETVKTGRLRLDSTSVKVHPDGTGALKKTDRKLGIYEYRARHYDRTIGRFISEDPIRFKGGLDFYAYTKNDPISYRDPLDLCGDCHVTCIRIATLLSVVQCLL